MASRSDSSGRAFPGFAHTYVLDDPLANRPYRADLELTDEFALLRGEASRDKPIRGWWAMGSSTPGDVVWTTLAVPVLLSERVVELLRERKFTGWDVVPVELQDKGGGALPTYYFLRIRGRCGPIDNSRSVRFDKLMPGGVRPRWRGLYFDPATWDGSDVFTSSSDVAWIFVVEEVKRALEKAKVRNVRFTPLDEVEQTFL